LANIGIETAGSLSFPSWRRGTINLGGGASLDIGLNLTIPAHMTVIGINTFTLSTADVTPSPYNQPPYPPSGDTDYDLCIVEGIVPQPVESGGAERNHVY
jgi:hypothetical protein